MLIEKNIQHILNQLVEGNSVKVPFDGSNITVRIIDDATKLSLSAPIYEGENYIPKSVRGCLSLKFPFFNPSIRTYLTVDEHHFQIKLNYLGKRDLLTQRELKDLLEEFGIMTEKWRCYLDDHDKRDLIHVKTK